MSLEEAHKEKDTILSIIANGLAKVFKDTNRTEEIIVADLVINLPKIINTELSPLFRRYRINAQSGSVFVHGKPWAKSAFFPESTPKSVEIADLLLIMTYVQLDGSISRNSLLLQAKMVDQIPFIPDHHNQHHLYVYWPKFEWIDQSPKLNGKVRNVTAPGLYQGYNYLLIGKNSSNISIKGITLESIIELELCCNDTTAVCAQPDYKKLSHYRSFINTLYDFIFGNTGRPFIFQPKNSLNWDQVITDLMEVTAEKVSRYIERASSGKVYKRGRGVILSGDLSNSLGGLLSYPKETVMEHQGLINEDSIPPDEPLFVNDEDLPDPGGVPIIEIKISEEQ